MGYSATVHHLPMIIAGMAIPATRAIPTGAPTSVPNCHSIFFLRDQGFVPQNVQPDGLKIEEKIYWLKKSNWKNLEEKIDWLKLKYQFGRKNILVKKLKISTWKNLEEKKLTHFDQKCLNDQASWWDNKIDPFKVSINSINHRQRLT